MKYTLYVFLTFSYVCEASRHRDTVIYQQKVTLDYTQLIDFVSFRNSVGTLFLTQDSLIFRTHKKKHIDDDFAFAYAELALVDTDNSLLFPNRIKIILLNGERYRLYTYKRRKIISIVQNQMINFNRKKLRINPDK
jgi:hypothetical protein